MKKCCLSIIAFLLFTSLYAHSRVTFTVSKPLCLLTFLQAANGTGSIAPSLTAYLRKNMAKEDSAGFYRLVNDFTNLGFDFSYVFPEYPLPRQHPKTVINLITIAAVQSRTIDEFMGRIVGILPNEQWLRLKKVMEKAWPYYDRMIYRPYYNEIQDQLAALTKYNNRTDAIFNKLKQFYGSTWGNDMPFTISMYPIPGNKGGTTATPHSNSIVLAVLTGERDYDMSVGIAVHEMCHVLFEEQPLVLQQMIDSCFLHSSSAYKRYAYSYIDEAMATACGNGWAYKALSGHNDKTSWYNDEYINGYAHAIYPLVQQYIEDGRTLDNDFIKKAITIFKETFPGAIYDYNVLLNRVNFYTDADNGKQYQQVYSILSKQFNISSCEGAYPIADPQAQDIMKQSVSTQLFLVYTHNAKNYAALKKAFPQIKNMRPDKEGIISFIDSKKRPVIIMNVKGIGRLNNGLSVIAKAKKMNPDKMFMPLK